MKKKREKQKRISEKISVLKREGEPQDKAVATAINMERSGRLSKGGKYRHVGRKKRKGERK